jgi:hypothetical protein
MGRYGPLGQLGSSAGRRRRRRRVGRPVRYKVGGNGGNAFRARRWWQRTRVGGNECYILLILYHEFH